MKRQIVLVQHCEAEHHVNGMVGSWTDTELTDFGRVQASRVAARVSEIVGESENWKLVSSDLMRCAQTAEIVGEMISEHPVFEAGLREYNLGEAVGKTVEWAQQNEKKNRGFLLELTGDHLKALKPGGSFTDESVIRWKDYSQMKSETW